MPRPQRSNAAWAALLVFLVLRIPGTAQAAETDSAEAVVARALDAVRVDPDESRRLAEHALGILARTPNTDLEIRARLILCDYLSERDRAGAEEQIARAIALLDQTERKGLRSGVLGCRGTIMETIGDNASARHLYEQAIEVA